MRRLGYTAARYPRLLGAAAQAGPLPFQLKASLRVEDVSAYSQA